VVRNAGTIRFMGTATERRGGAGRSEQSVDEVVNALLVASRALVALAARSMTEVENTVTLTQFRTLVVLETHDGINLNRLAELLGVNASTAMRMIDRLIAAGLVSRRGNPKRRREVVLSLTAAGERMVRRVMNRRRDEIAHVVEHMPSAQRTSMIEALRMFSDAAGEPLPRGQAALDWVTDQFGSAAGGQRQSPSSTARSREANASGCPA
jgi:DNA-binding MarR family transcriptional regulator